MIRTKLFCKLIWIDLDLNSQPNITNLPSTVSVDEDIAGGTVIFTLTSQDLDPTDPLTHSFSVSPITAQGLFSFDSASEFNLKIYDFDLG